MARANCVTCNAGIPYIMGKFECNLCEYKSAIAREKAHDKKMEEQNTSPLAHLIPFRPAPRPVSVYDYNLTEDEIKSVLPLRVRFRHWRNQYRSKLRHAWQCLR